MKSTIISRADQLDHQEVSSGEDFHFFRHKFIRGEDGYKSNIAFLRLPPKRLRFCCIILNTARKPSTSSSAKAT